MLHSIKSLVPHLQLLSPKFPEETQIVFSKPKCKVAQYPTTVNAEVWSNSFTEDKHNPWMNRSSSVTGNCEPLKVWHSNREACKKNRNAYCLHRPLKHFSRSCLTPESSPQLTAPSFSPTPPIFATQIYNRLTLGSVEAIAPLSVSRQYEIVTNDI